MSIVYITVSIIFIGLGGAVAGIGNNPDINNKTAWNNLSNIQRQYYDNNFDNSIIKYKVNMILVGIFMLIIAVILLTIGILICIFRRTIESIIGKWESQDDKKLPAKEPFIRIISNAKLAFDNIMFYLKHLSKQEQKTFNIFKK